MLKIRVPIRPLSQVMKPCPRRLPFTRGPRVLLRACQVSPPVSAITAFSAASSAELGATFRRQGLSPPCTAPERRTAPAGSRASRLRDVGVAAPIGLQILGQVGGGGGRSLDEVVPGARRQPGRHRRPRGGRGRAGRGCRPPEPTAPGPRPGVRRGSPTWTASASKGAGEPDGGRVVVPPAPGPGKVEQAAAPCTVRTVPRPRADGCAAAVPRLRRAVAGCTQRHCSLPFPDGQEVGVVVPLPGYGCQCVPGAGERRLVVPFTVGAGLAEQGA